MSTSERGCLFLHGLNGPARWVADAAQLKHLLLRWWRLVGLLELVDSDEADADRKPEFERAVIVHDDTAVVVWDRRVASRWDSDPGEASGSDWVPGTRRGQRIRERPATPSRGSDVPNPEAELSSRRPLPPAPG